MVARYSKCPCKHNSLEIAWLLFYFHIHDICASNHTHAIAGKKADKAIFMSVKSTHNIVCATVNKVQSNYSLSLHPKIQIHIST